MSVLRLAPLGGTTVGPALAAVGSAALARRGGTAYVEVPVADVPRLVRALAYGGIAAEHCDADLAAPVGLIAAVGLDLDPLPAELVAFDSVRVRRLPLGAAVREILRRRYAGLLPASVSARGRCRALLRGESAMLAWERRAWASRSALRAAPASRSLRPVVFDRAALERTDLAGRTSSADADLAHWLFG